MCPKWFVGQHITHRVVGQKLFTIYTSYDHMLCLYDEHKKRTTYKEQHNYHVCTDMKFLRKVLPRYHTLAIHVIIYIRF
jgi:hypothetical protein